MDYKEKHKEDLESAKGWLAIAKENNNKQAVQILENLFPELRESEAERIKSAAIEFVRQNKSFNCCLGVSKEEVVAWLEKQVFKSNPYIGVSFSYNGNTWGMCARDNGVDILFDNELIQHISGEMQGEQKTEIEYIRPRFKIGDVIEPIKPNGFNRPVRVLSIEKKTKSYYCESDDEKSFSSIPIRCEDEYKIVEQKLAWNKEDERMFSGLISIVEDWYNTMSEEEKEYYGDCGYINWLNSIKDRVQPQPKQEWSEEDEKMLDGIIDCIDGLCFIDSDQLNWLKSIKPNHWKPSEEQMKALNWIAYNYALMDKGTEEKLQSLYNDLKNF